MTSTFVMPSLGADMEAGTLVEWLKRPGDPIRRGDVIAVVETQKGAIEVEVFQDGVLDRLLVEPGAKVPVGTPLALIAGAGAASAAPPAPQPAAVPVAEPLPPPRPAGIAVAPSLPDTVRISPAAQRLAHERGITDLAAIRGTGPGGAIVSEDIDRLPRKPERRGIDFAAMREAIAAAMARSKREIPHFYLTHCFEIAAATDWLAQINAERPPERRLLLAGLLIKAVAQALAKAPEFNGTWRDGQFQRSQAVHVGMAINLRSGGLIAPAIREVDRRSLDDVMVGLHDLVQRARNGQLRSSELSDPTITVSSLGDRGVDALYGVIYPPQVALVGFGAPSDRPWAVDGGAVAVRPALTATLAADHRVSDGHRGALFLAEIAERLQHPERL